MNLKMHYPKGCYLSSYTVKIALCVCVRVCVKSARMIESISYLHRAWGMFLLHRLGLRGLRVIVLRSRLYYLSKLGPNLYQFWALLYSSVK